MQLPSNATAEQIYAFEERAGICMDSHATKAEAEAWAYREIFHYEPPEDRMETMLL